MYVWRSEENWVSVLSFHLVGPRDWAQVCRLGKGFYAIFPTLILFYFWGEFLTVVYADLKLTI